MQNTHVTTLDKLPLINQFKIGKSMACKQAFENFVKAEKDFNETFERILNFTYEVDEAVAESLEWVLGVHLDKAPIDINQALLAERLSDYKEWTSVSFEALTLIKMLQQRAVVSGREHVVALAKSWKTFKPAYDLLDGIEASRSALATELTKAENALMAELEKTKITGADKKEYDALVASKNAEAHAAADAEILEEAVAEELQVQAQA